MKAVVLGGYGATGAFVVELLREAGDDVMVAGRDPDRSDRVLDLRSSNRDPLRAAAAEADVVINASGVEDADAAEFITRCGAAFIDLTATTRYIAALESITPHRPVVVSVGLAPGLTNLVAAEVHAVSPGPIDIAILLGAGERHGAAGVAWSYSLLGRRFLDPGTGAPVRNYTKSTTFDLPGTGCKRLYRADFADQHVLSRDLAVPVRTYFGLDSRLATAALAMLTWLPGGSHAPKGLHLPGDDRWLVLARGHDGTQRWVTGRVQSRATAIVAVAAARALARLEPGVHHLHKVLALDDVLGDLHSISPV